MHLDLINDQVIMLNLISRFILQYLNLVCHNKQIWQKNGPFIVSNYDTVWG